MGSIPSTKKLCSVAIVGGGVGGLALAVGLLRRGVSVQVYEAAPKFEEVGLGLSIGPAAHRAMRLIDPQIRNVYDSLVTTHADSPGYEHLRQTWFEIIWATGPKAGQMLMDLKAPPSGQTTVRRADFLASMVDLVSPEIRHFGKRLESLDEDDTGVTLMFKDRTTATADIVIGCDGIKSKVKKYVVSSEDLERTLPRYSGMYGYRAALDMETMVTAVGDDRARVATMYIGDGAYAISYPIQRAQKVNVGLYKLSDHWDSDTWVRPASQADMHKDFDHMGSHIQAIMKYMQDPSQWAIFEHPSLTTFTKSRVAIIGDAAHASTPHQGAGAGQAIEDAHVLAEILADPNVTEARHFTAALKAYDMVRRPRSQQVVVSSKENGNLLCLRLDGILDDEDKLRDTFSKRFRWLWDVDIEGQAENARELMLRLIKQGELQTSRSQLGT